MKSFVDNEPISQIVVRRLKLSPTKVFIVLLLVHIILEIIPGLVFDFNVTNRVYIGVLEDYAGLVLGLIVLPFSWAFFAWLPQIVHKNLIAICKNNIIHKKDQLKFNKIVDQVIGITTKKYYITISILLPIGMTIFAQLAIAQYDPPYWAYTIPLYHYIFLAPKMALSFYIFFQYVLWTILLIILLNKIFSSISINLIPYHQDNASGLGIVGEFSFGIGRLSLIMGLFIIGEIVTAITRGQGMSQINIILEVIAFPVFTVLFFFLPLISCRKAMIKAKNEILQGIGEKIQKAIVQIGNKGEPSRKDFEEFHDLVKYQQKLREDIRTWPISVDLFRKFSLRFLISSIPGIFSIGMQLIKFISDAS